MESEEQLKKEKDYRLKLIGVSDSGKLNDVALDIKRYMEEKGLQEKRDFIVDVNFRDMESDLLEKIGQYTGVALEIPFGNQVHLQGGMYIGYQIIVDVLRKNFRGRKRKGLERSFEMEVGGGRRDEQTGVIG
ncbi:MAG: hypothetical protein ACOCUU_03330 [Nanoarchaeota archaeon]